MVKKIVTDFRIHKTLNPFIWKIESASCSGIEFYMHKIDIDRLIGQFKHQVFNDWKE